MSAEDAVTKLLDRQTFENDYEQLFQSAVQNGQHLSLVVVDIDRFKRVNDTYGHQIGDRVLAEVARRLRSVAEMKGRVYRYGGEEMVMVLPNHSPEEAIAVAERTRMLLSATPIEGLTITASFGIACMPDHSVDPQGLLREADMAMYDAKERGRDLVRVSGEPEPAQGKTRAPGRKQPEPGQLSDSTKEQLRIQHFQGRRIRCPKDGAILTVQGVSTLGSSQDELLIRCPLCGMVEQLGGE